VVVPHVDTELEAKRIADHCRFPPIGHRSMGGGLQQLGFAASDACSGRGARQ
jgi:2-keto-3-deoxy-L-rhamnonate aldolase RhmA